MCSGIEVKKPALLFTASTTDYKANKMVMSPLIVETEDSFSSLLEYVTNNDVQGFKRSIEKDPSSIDEVGLWYVRKKGLKQIVLEHRTPLMVACTYGNMSVLKLIVSQPKVDVNFTCGLDKCTALHYPNIEDANGNRPVDVILVPPKSSGVRSSLEELLTNNVNTSSDGSVIDCKLTALMAHLCRHISLRNHTRNTIFIIPLICKALHRS
ncbi:putative ankyrin repeat-containing domain superfamily [Helianthus annuus]|nr:putative ankyrin repeat-containing domain superfamily [Helianthus annuus]KAJ0614090.1 putative ankyrin repeat-containing domain superfamily [Helianthus annuus]